MNGILISFLTLPVANFYMRDMILIEAGENYSISEVLGYCFAVFGLAVQSVSDM